MKELQNYTSALQDVGLDSTPSRDEQGQYQWSNGQFEILNRPEFNQLRQNKVKIAHLNGAIKDLSAEMLAFEMPIHTLEIEGDGILSIDRDEIDEHRNQLQQYKESLAQLDKDMLIRGYIPPGEKEKPNATESDNPSGKSLKKISLKEIMGFMLIWFVGEVFMTYVQWNSLRDGRGIEDMIVRSISLGVVLFLIHLVGRYYKKEHRKLHLAFLGFSFLMLFTMLLGPLLLNEAYPPLDQQTDIATQWSLDESTVTTPQEPVNPYPFWVNFYRKNDMLPGIFVFLFFVIMQTFDRKKPKPVLPEPKPTLLTPEIGKNQIEERREYYLQQIKLIEARLQDLYQQQSKAVAPNTLRLQHILDELQEKQAKMITLKKQKDDLLTENDGLLRKLEMYLNQYRTEYLNVLKNDSVKAMVTNPEWPDTQDLKTYFAIP